MRAQTKRMPAAGNDHDPLSRLASVLDGGIRVAVVVEQNDVLRHGLAGLLAHHEQFHVILAGVRELPELDLDVAIVCGTAARQARFSCPIIVCSDGPLGAELLAPGNEVAGMLDQRTLTGAQLTATVHAAAAGLNVNSRATVEPAAAPLEPRAQRVVEMLADGNSTREIANAISYSERTIKKLITDLEQRYEARTRAQLVARVIRHGLI